MHSASWLHRRINLVAFVLQHQVAGINHDVEIGPATRRVRCVHRRVGASLGGARERGNQMPAGGETERADSLRVEAEFFRARAEQAECALRVLQRRGVPLDPSRFGTRYFTAVTPIEFNHSQTSVPSRSIARM